MFVFKELVLENKNLSKLFYLYDELTTKKSLSESMATELINESIVLYENTINKITKKQFNDLNLWLSDIKVKNNYENLDNLFSSNVLTLENKIKSKKIILENLKETSSEITEISEKIPLSKLVSAANKTVNDYLDTINESDKKKLKSILSEDEKKLKLKFEVIKENVIEKLEEIKESENDNETLTRINETLNKVSSEEFSRINYFKLYELNKNI
jgi:Rad3-related DNA helicase